MLSKESDKPILFKYLEDVFNDLEQQKFALDQSTIVTFTGTKGNITYVNENFCETPKYRKEELLGQNHQIINLGYLGAVKTFHEKKLRTKSLRGKIKKDIFIRIMTIVIYCSLFYL